MARAYSNDLRERVAAAVLAGGSCREIAALFRVSVSSAVKWSQRLRVTGTAAARPMGGRRPQSLAAHREWLMKRLAGTPDVTLRALVVELGERGVVTSYGSVWRILHDAGMRFKKNAVRQRARPARRRPAALAMAKVSGKT
jgi:transposase